MKSEMRTGHASTLAGDLIGSKLIEGILAAGPDLIFKTCMSCRHMAEVGPAICQKFGQTPPVATILQACPSYDDKEEIPF